ncbi:MAG: hypothetical protein WBE76_22090 [Terracidiphilus sp.]
MSFLLFRRDLLLPHLLLRAWLARKTRSGLTGWSISRRRCLLRRRGVSHRWIGWVTSARLSLSLLTGSDSIFQVGNIAFGIVLEHRLRTLAFGGCLGGRLFAIGAEEPRDNHDRACPKEHNRLHVLLQNAAWDGSFVGEFRLCHGFIPSV